ncbi:LysR family transcriptional regulator [Acuticoccus sediminis]|uniref:LysR family transcriptional regulator n=1 Tax=Acuticoccus sediminis TaxID=2184697 RepID=A0A8B2NKM5_9HYPH|nr:LysR substrate-binding domain-containing protein [Acuticoccus sediminis]RAI00056.1 LysR family transcriptional regulator [Acuticoccus sediminis]
MTLDQVRIFLAVAERRHVTRAAEALNLTQSAVSSAISALEAQHGVRLFDRVGRGIEPTEAGLTFMEAARSLLAQAETTKLVLDDLASEMRGRLRITASQTVASYWLPRHLMALHDRHPGVEIDLTVGNTATAAAAVMDGTADLGFVEGELPSSDLHIQVVARDELVLVLARDHAERRRPSFSAGDYRALRWVLREPGSGTRSAFETHLRALNLATGDLEVTLELPSNEAVLAAVAAGGCVTMLSRRAVGSFRTRHIALRRVTWTPRPLRTFSVLTHPQRHKTRAARALVGLVTAG